MKDLTSNDYAVAKELNNYALTLLGIFDFYQIIGPHKDFDTKEINRLYVLLVEELSELYDRNPKLSEIRPEPIWREIDYIFSAYDLQKYMESFEWKPHADLHNAKIDRLTIVSDSGKPNYSSKQKRLIDSIQSTIDNYHKLLIAEVKKRPPAEELNGWFIEEYTLTYKPDGTILINDALKLKKVHAGSATEHLLEQAFKNQNELFMPNIGKTSRNLSTIISSAGFTPVLRALFFPTVSNDKGIVFRSRVTLSEAISDHIDISKLDQQLKDAGAVIIKTEPDIDELEYVETI